METKPTPGTILIVDDAVENLQLLSQILTDRDYQIRVAKTGQEAIASVNADLPDLVLLDIILPDINGYEVCSTLKANEKTSAVPVVFISALNETADKLRGFAAGGADFISKPFVSEEILVRVKTHIEIGHLRSQLINQAAELQLKNDQLQVELSERKLAAEKLMESFAKLEDSKISALNLLEDLKTEIDQRKQTEEKIRETQILLQASIESPKDMIILSIDKNYRYLNFNSVHKHVMSSAYGKDVKIGMNLLDCITNNDDRRKAKINYDRALKGESHITVEEYGDTERYYYETRYNPILNEKNEIIGTTAFSANITERKRAEEALQESEKRYRLLFEQARDSIMLLEIKPDGIPIIRDANTAAQKTLGFSYEELIGQPVSMMDAEKDFSPLVRERNRQAQDAEGAVFEVQHRRKDGSTFDVESSVKQMTVGGKRLSLVIERDITERKRAEEALKLAHNELKNLHNNLDEAIFSFDAVQNKMLQVSVAHEAVFGYPPADFFRNSQLWYECILPEDKPIVDAGYPVLMSGKSLQHEVRIIRADGQMRWIEAKMKPTLDANGKFVHIDGIVSDITERKLAEEALAESETKYRQLVARSPEGIFIIDLSGTFLSVNKTMCDNLKYTEEEFLTMKMWDIVPEQYWSLHKQRLGAIMNGGSTNAGAEYEVKGKDGIIHFVEVLSAPYYKGKEIIGFQGIARDITGRKQAENSLRLLSLRQEALLYAVPEIIMEVDNNKVYRWANKHGLEFFGEDVLGHEAADYFEGEQKTYSIVQPVFNGSEDLIYLESWQRRKDGQKRLLAWWCHVLKDENGQVTGALSTARDITEHTRAEEALQESEERLRITLEVTKIGIWDWNIKNDIWHASPMFYSMLGYEPVSGPSDREVWLQRVHPDEREAVAGKIKKVIDGLGDDYQYEARMKHADGSYRWHSVMGNTIEWENDGKPSRLIGVRMDITDRKQAEEEIKNRVEELERFNRLAVGREMRMIELKQKINALSAQLGLAPPYPLAIPNNTNDNSLTNMENP